VFFFAGFLIQFINFLCVIFFITSKVAAVAIAPVSVAIAPVSVAIDPASVAINPVSVAIDPEKARRSLVEALFRNC